MSIPVVIYSKPEAQHHRPNLPPPVGGMDALTVSGQQLGERPTQTPSHPQGTLLACSLLAQAHCCSAPPSLHLIQ